jgi:hypothetical protein
MYEAAFNYVSATHAAGRHRSAFCASIHMQAHCTLNYVQKQEMHSPRNGNTYVELNSDACNSVIHIFIYVYDIFSSQHAVKMRRRENTGVEIKLHPRGYHVDQVIKLTGNVTRLL